MKTIPLLALAVLTTASAAFAQQAKPQSFDSQFGMLDSRNPFLRERHKPRDSSDRNRDRDRNRSPVRTAAQSFVLRGVAIEDDQLHAYLEDSRSGNVVRVSPGDTLGDGRVVDVAIDAVAYELAGHLQWVEVGQDLTGTRSSGSLSAAPATGASTQPQGNAPAPLPPGGGSLEERMKARRAQQRGAK